MWVDVFIWTQCIIYSSDISNLTVSMRLLSGMVTRHQPSKPRQRPRHQTSRPGPRQQTEQNNQVINWHFNMCRPTSTLFEWIVSLTHYKTNTFIVYSHCNAPQHQSTACTIQFFDTLLNILSRPKPRLRQELSRPRQRPRHQPSRPRPRH